MTILLFTFCSKEIVSLKKKANIFKEDAVIVVDEVGSPPEIFRAGAAVLFLSLKMAGRRIKHGVNTRNATNNKWATRPERERQVCRAEPQPHRFPPTAPVISIIDEHDSRRAPNIGRMDPPRSITIRRSSSVRRNNSPRLHQSPYFVKNRYLS